MAPTRYNAPNPLKAKGDASSVAHLSVPLKGLSLSSKLTTGDPMTAPILTNFVVEDDRIVSRAGFQKMVSLGSASVETLIPFYAATSSTHVMLGASGGNLYNAIAGGAALKTGFTSNDWSWTAFANLGQVKYAVMVNGANGVWSWNGVLTGASIVKETVTAPTAETWISTDAFNIVLAHCNRLWFADKTNLAVYYLPLQQKSGEVKVLPLNALFKRGGSIQAMYTWTLEGGTSTNDQLVIFSTNGECAIYQGTDPDDVNNFSLVGIFRFDSPMSKNCVVNYGGELYVLISTGVVPLSTMLRAESEQLGIVDQNVVTAFRSHAVKYRSWLGWSLQINPSTGRLIANLPSPDERSLYSQYIRNMPKPVWSSWEGVPSRCWAWISPYLYFGDDKGNTYRMHPDIVNDDGAPLVTDVQLSWSSFRTAGIKHFKMVRAYVIADSVVRPFIDVKTDYDNTPPEMQPDTSTGATAYSWNVADWNTSDWAPGPSASSLWNGVGRLGRVGAIRMSASLLSSSMAITGFDVIYEPGSVI